MSILPDAAQARKGGLRDDGSDVDHPQLAGLTSDDGPEPLIGSVLLDGDAQGDVCGWRIDAVGNRTKDHLARDCLFGTLFRDPRVPWFHRYVRRPPPWMSEQVAHLGDGPAGKLALQHVALHYLHKRHLARVRAHLLDDPDDDEEAVLERVWRCPPYGVLVSRRDGRPVPHPCGVCRLCPWCHARKVTALYGCLIAGPLRRPPPLPYFGRATVMEPKFTDLADVSRGGLIRGMRKAAARLGLVNGVVTHQVGPAVDLIGLPTFIHEIGVIAGFDLEALDRTGLDDDEPAFEDGYDDAWSEGGETDFRVFWLRLQTTRRAVRFALAGSPQTYPVENLEQDPKWFHNHHRYPMGIRGALGWQPTFLYPPHVWGTATRVMKHLRLYQPFGTWRGGLGRAFKASRESAGDRLARLQSTARTRARQQRGNRRRHEEAEGHRAALLAAAMELWPSVLAQPNSGKGRPPRRSLLSSMLAERGFDVSRRDMDWLMNQLQPARTS